MLKSTYQYKADKYEKSEGKSYENCNSRQEY